MLVFSFSQRHPRENGDPDSNRRDSRRSLSRASSRDGNDMEYGCAGKN